VRRKKRKNWRWEDRGNGSKKKYRTRRLKIKRNSNFKGKKRHLLRKRRGRFSRKEKAPRPMGGSPPECTRKKKLFHGRIPWGGDLQSRGSEIAYKN